MAWLTVMVFGNASIVGGLFLLIAMAVHLAFFAMLGLLLSVVCRTTVSAYVSLVIVALFQFSPVKAIGISFRDCGAFR